MNDPFDLLTALEANCHICIGALWVVSPTTANAVTPPGGSRVAYMNQKFKAKSDANSVGDIPYMRASEMFLIEAEALARNNNETGSKTAFTTFMKTRVPTYTTSTQTGDAYITALLFLKLKRKLGI